MSTAFPHLFSEITLGRTVVRNRIVSTGHHTHHSHGPPSERYIAYQEARAKGGAGLIVSEVATIHDTAFFHTHSLQAKSPECIPGYRRLAKAVKKHGASLFGQLFHPGREIQATEDGMFATAYSPSAVPNERFHIMPRPMSEAMIREIIDAFGRGAGYLVEAGLDGVELVASQGYLPAQFFNPRLNHRDDMWGGSFENRLRFASECLTSMRAAIGGATLGMRISGHELEPAQGLSDEEIAQICAALAPQLLKAQDTIVICPSTFSQKLALAAMEPGRAWVQDRVQGLHEQKALVLDALHSVLPKESVRGGSGAIYLFCKLPEGVSDDLAAVRWLTAKHRVATIPGSACGMPGYFRVCYANLPLEKTREAAARLGAGLAELAAGQVDLSDEALAKL